MKAKSAPVIPFAIALLVASAACAPEDSASTEQLAGQDTAFEAEIDEIRAATSRFRTPDAALAAGYIPDPSGMCITAEMEGYPAEDGAMGIHYFRPDLLGITATEPRVAGMGAHTDFREPGVLVYAPGADGSLELVAVENLIFEAGWQAAGHSGPPSFHGVEYTRLENDPSTEIDEAHGFEPHYELHLWVFRDNPRGVATPFNPNVSCGEHAHAM